MSVLVWGWLFTLPGLLVTAFGLPPGRKRAGILSVPGPLVLLVVAVWALVTSGGTAAATVTEIRWVPFLPDGAFRLLADSLSAVMLTVLGFVASLVYVYSLGYMAEDASRRRFFVFLDVFVATMGLLVLAGNLAVLLVGWTGVGISSFLLISFWRDRPNTLRAGLEALAANAIGDAALLIAASIVPIGCGSLVGLGTPQCTTGVGGAPLLAALLFIAASAKSAQGPLYFWLPSAMAGPTPISALIHAATMVAAGVYLLVRTHALIAMAPNVAAAIALIGVLTAIGGGIAGYVQPNFKRGIAYSTISQLGYMFAAVGVGSPFAAMFHLVTHAAFKALLFLSAGVVIHGMDGEELLSRLSGAGRRFPVSYVGFLVGSLALIGTPAFSGSFSKDSIISASLASPMSWVGWLLLAAVFLTGLYIGRLFFRVYHGPLPDPAMSAATTDTAAHQEGHAVHSGAGEHDPSAQRLMDGALIPLILAAILAGYLAWPSPWLQSILAGAVGAAPALPFVTPYGLGAFALGLLGAGIAWVQERRPARIVPGQEASATQPSAWVSALATGGSAVAQVVSQAQSGYLARYAWASLCAAAVILVLRLVVAR